MGGRHSLCAKSSSSVTLSTKRAMSSMVFCTEVGHLHDGVHVAERVGFFDGLRLHRAVANEDAEFFHPLAAHGKRVPEFRAMSTVAEIIEAVKELPETEKGVLFRERDPLREPEASRGSLARKNGRWVLRGGEAAAAAFASDAALPWAGL